MILKQDSSINSVADNIGYKMTNTYSVNFGWYIPLWMIEVKLKWINIPSINCYVCGYFILYYMFRPFLSIIRYYKLKKILGRRIIKKQNIFRLEYDLNLYWWKLISNWYTSGLSYIPCAMLHSEQIIWNVILQTPLKL